MTGLGGSVLGLTCITLLALAAGCGSAGDGGGSSESAGTGVPGAGSSAGATGTSSGSESSGSSAGSGNGEGGASTRPAAFGVVFVHGTGDQGDTPDLACDGSGDDFRCTVKAAVDEYWTQETVDSERTRLDGGKSPYAVVGCRLGTLTPWANPSPVKAATKGASEPGSADCVAAQTLRFLKGPDGALGTADDIQNVVLVTHSGGSNVVRYILEQPTAKDDFAPVAKATRRVVALAAPSHGTYLANWVFTAGTLPSVLNGVLGLFGGEGVYNDDGVEFIRTFVMDRSNRDPAKFVKLGSSFGEAAVFVGSGTYPDAERGDPRTDCAGGTETRALNFLHDNYLGVPDAATYRDTCSDGFISCLSSMATAKTASERIVFGRTPSDTTQGKTRWRAHNQSRRSCDAVDLDVRQAVQGAAKTTYAAILDPGAEGAKGSAEAGGDGFAFAPSFLPGTLRTVALPPTAPSSPLTWVVTPAPRSDGATVLTTPRATSRGTTRVYGAGEAPPRLSVSLDGPGARVVMATSGSSAADPWGADIVVREEEGPRLPPSRVIVERGEGAVALRAAEGAALPSVLVVDLPEAVRRHALVVDVLDPATTRPLTVELSAPFVAAGDTVEIRATLGEGNPTALTTDNETVVRARVRGPGGDLPRTVLLRREGGAFVGSFATPAADGARVGAWTVDVTAEHHRGSASVERRAQVAFQYVAPLARLAGARRANPGGSSQDGVVLTVEAGQAARLGVRATLVAMGAGASIRSLATVQASRDVTAGLTTFELPATGLLPGEALELRDVSLVCHDNASTLAWVPRLAL